jgi:hypothetical protein
LLKQTRTESPIYIDASTEVTTLYRVGELTQERLADFAERQECDKTAIAMSLMCDLPVELVEQVLVRCNTEQLIILAKTAMAALQFYRMRERAKLLLAPPDFVSLPNISTMLTSPS